MAVRRRVIWMSDENWDHLGRVVAHLQSQTKATGLSQRITPSLVILDCLVRGHFHAEFSERIDRAKTILATEEIFERQTDFGGRPFNSRPFTPVPKGGK